MQTGRPNGPPGRETVPALVVWAAAWLLAPTAEQRAIEHLAREVPSWFRENKCFSCHNNGDGARALSLARRKGSPVASAALADTTAWLLAPARWESNHGDPKFSDKKLARLQFAAALSELPDSGQALRQAAAMLANDQREDGSWTGDAGAPAGSPVTYNAALATYLARKVLLQAAEPRFDEPVARATRWLESKAIANTPDAAAIALATGSEAARQWLRAAQNQDGGWGPAPKMPSEVFDTSLALLALGRNAKARAYLLRSQLDAGGWPETTRPSGGQSYAQHISTTAWALIALLETAR